MDAGGVAYIADGPLGNVVLRSDGTVAGTTQTASPVPGRAFHLTPVDGVVFFDALHHAVNEQDVLRIVFGRSYPWPAPGATAVS